MFFSANNKKYTDDCILAPADAEMISIEEVKDDVFSRKLLGDGVAFILKNGMIASPANGKLTIVFHTGHAFGITTNEGVEILVHIGINTVECKQKGFRILAKEGSDILAGEPVIKADLKSLSKNYDMTTMLIITDPNGKDIRFIDYGNVHRKQKINR